MAKHPMSQPKKQRLSGKDSSFARARAKANALVDIAFSDESPKFETVRVGRSTKRLSDLKDELCAAQARVEALFTQPSMDARAIRRRIDLDSPEDKKQPFTMMAGVPR
ncbi:hypothetical protein [Cupriavidus sp. AcVe19-1a]|uniref:hypothetical protein n=1 Tax=Cupriavidus sp. AcVe19-1a TaxID=2821359 RepID=UPI001AE7D752|nr:hypothetical protein [Cupriavidus sp. AcVe19-1a]MBP0632389.1 hypothetical protein [Cupriavidus sp. AcVe19-1a]